MARLAVALAFFAAVAAVEAAPRPTGSKWEPTARTVVAPGLEHSRLRAGAPTRGRRFQVVVATREKMVEADQILARFAAERRGIGIGPSLQMTAVYISGRYEIRLTGFADRGPAVAARDRLAKLDRSWAPTVVEVGHDASDPAGPWSADVLEIDPRRFDVVAAHALDAAFGVETTRSLARRHGALAAVNGGFFVTKGALRGDSAGILQMAGRLLSEPDRGRAAVGFLREDGILRATFGRPALRAHARLGTETPGLLSIDGLNRERRLGEVILYTPEFHRTTLTEPPGIEWVVRAGRLAEVREGAGSTPIPADGFVLSFGPPGAAPGSEVGTPVAVEAGLVGAGGPQDPWPRVESALGAGPLLLSRGARVEEPEKESIPRVFWLARHPRTAAAARADGTILLVTVDGRQPGWSVGMSLDELTDLLLDLRAVDAVNLDGGGSTTMVVRGETVNRPSDPGGERENGDGLLVFGR